MGAEVTTVSVQQLVGQRDLFERLNRVIAPGDSMYHGNERYYFECGASALAAIEDALAVAGVAPNQVRTILDYACGFGRVLRWLKVAFPSAELGAIDIDETALEFVKNVLAVRTQNADISLSTRLDSSFDLIWCGSLVTHLSETDSSALLKYLASHLNNGGLLAFTTHGPYVARRVRSGEKLYGLEADEAEALLAQYDSSDYGFGVYPKRRGYGISACKVSRMMEIIEAAGMSPVYYREKGWVKHQDVFACRSSNPL